MVVSRFHYYMQEWSTKNRKILERFEKVVVMESVVYCFIRCIYLRQHILPPKRKAFASCVSNLHALKMTQSRNFIW